MTLRAVWALTALTAIAPTGAAAAESLVIGFVERPAYAYMEAGRPRGLLIERAREVLDRAGIEYRFEPLPARRMAKTVRSRPDFCLIGNFRTPEREQYAQFSRPLFRNRPIGILVTAARRAEIQSRGSLAALTASPGLRLGYVDGFSYGAGIDAVVSAMSGPKVPVSAGPAEMVRLLAAGRFDYMFADHEEWEALAQASKVPTAALAVLNFPDQPAGNTRHFMCSRKLAPGLLTRIDAAIGD